MWMSWLSRAGDFGVGSEWSVEKRREGEEGRGLEGGGTRGIEDG